MKELILLQSQFTLSVSVVMIEGCLISSHFRKVNILEKKTDERREETIEGRQSTVNGIRTYRTLKTVIVKGNQ